MKTSKDFQSVRDKLFQMNKKVKCFVYDSFFQLVFCGKLAKRIEGELVSVFPNTFFGTSDNRDAHATVLITYSESNQYKPGKFYIFSLSDLLILD